MTSALKIVHEGLGGCWSSSASVLPRGIRLGSGSSGRFGSVAFVVVLLFVGRAAGKGFGEQTKGEAAQRENQSIDAFGGTKDFVLRKPKGRPQFNLALTGGVLGRSEGEGTKTPTGVWSSTRGHLGLHGDVIFGRKSAFDWGVGPFGEVMTAFDDISFGTGATVHVPVHRALPILVSAGGYGRYGGQWSGGLSGQLFWGIRRYDDDSSYVGSIGLMAQGRFGIVGQQKERTIVVALHVDLAALCIPMVALASVVKGG